MTAALDVISDYLDWRGFTHVRLDGSTGSAERGAIVDQFNDPGAAATALDSAYFSTNGQHAHPHARAENCTYTRVAVTSVFRLLPPQS